MPIAPASLPSTAGVILTVWAAYSTVCFATIFSNGAKKRKYQS